jgi:hypothetical protein
MVLFKRAVGTEKLDSRSAKRSFSSWACVLSSSAAETSSEVHTAEKNKKEKRYEYLPMERKRELHYFERKDG